MPGFGDTPVVEDKTERSSTSMGNADAAAASPKPAKKERPKMKARFGSVRVAWHRMTLGAAHPGGTEGVPVTLGELEEAERYATVDNFSQKFHYDPTNHEHIEKKKMERLTASFRRNIGSRSRRPTTAGCWSRRSS